MHKFTAKRNKKLFQMRKKLNIFNACFNLTAYFSFCIPIELQNKENQTADLLDTGADLGGRTLPLPQGFDPPPTQRVNPLILFQKSIFGRPTLKLF